MSSTIGSLTPTPSEIDTDDEDQLMSMSDSSTSSSRASSPLTPPPPSYRSRPSLTISYPMQPSNAASSRLNITFPVQTKSLEQSDRFVVPAHPQSHHLHVLPPRKKTTRLLIIDHTIWRLVRTRFAQARCELGMHVKLKSHAWHEQTDSDRNSSGFHTAALHADQYHHHQHQHGNFGDPPEIDTASSDEEDDVGGKRGEEDITPETLYGKSNNIRTRDEDGGGDDEAMDVDSDVDEDDQSDQRRRAASHNKRHAPFLSARADGMQKVLFTILAQPPDPSPPIAFSKMDDSALYSTSLESLKALPNRLRLGLMLLRIVDDLFGLPKTTAESLITSPPETAPSASTSPLPPSFLSRVPIVDTLPADLKSLFQISNQSLSPIPKPTTSFFHTLSLPSSSSSVTSSSGGFNTPNAIPKSFVFSWNGSTESLTGKSEPATGDEPGLQTGPRVGPPSSSSSLSSSSQAVKHHIPRVNPAAGDPLTWRLHSRNILDDSHKQGSAAHSHSIARSVKQASGRTRDLYSLGCIPDPSSTAAAPVPVARFSSSVIPLSFGSKATITTGQASRNTPQQQQQQAYPIEKLKTLCLRHLREKCTICVRNSEARTRIGAGLLSTSTTGVAGRDDGGSFWFLDRRRRLSNQMNGGVADLISDFLRLSAYIISELQEYVVSDDEDEDEEDQDEDHDEDGDDGTDAEIAGLKSRSTSPSEEHDHVTAEEDMSHKPTRAWYSLLCGLITRTVLEGYVSRGWKGSKYAEVLMGIGLGVEDDTPPPPPAPPPQTTKPETSSGNRAPDDSEDIHPKSAEGDEDYLPEGTPSLIEACHILFDGFGKNIKASNKEVKPPEREYISAMELRMSEFLEIPHSCPDLATHLTGLSAKYPAEPVERAALQFCEAVSKWRGKPELEMYKIRHKAEVSPSPDLWIRKYFQIPTPENHHGLERNKTSSSSPPERSAKRQLSPSPQTESFPPASKKGKLESGL
ncbi:hypothetical protein Clacol_000309 [Clathrus columnatus]|uniref:Uncharacterized protein n=1 Tax=Clathrus columnatus TaxID=1419009 RepID=A0AAV4ZWY3_9AGAM|nr:hypothetical protein Clacol_000309 [Clathrus columnatus]